MWDACSKKHNKAQWNHISTWLQRASCFPWAWVINLLFLSPAEVAHQFQYAVRVIGSNYAPTIERDEFLVSEKIKKECKSCLPVTTQSCYRLLDFCNTGLPLACSIRFCLVSHVGDAPENLLHHKWQIPVDFRGSQSSTISGENIDPRFDGENKTKIVQHLLHRMILHLPSSGFYGNLLLPKTFVCWLDFYIDSWCGWIKYLRHGVPEMFSLET